MMVNLIGDEDFESVTHWYTKWDGELIVPASIKGGPMSNGEY